MLALDIIGNDETFATDRFEVVVTGFDFGTTACDTGAVRRRSVAVTWSGTTRATTSRSSNRWRRTTASPSAARIDGFVDVDLPPAPAPPDRPGRLQPARSPDDPGGRGRCGAAPSSGTAGAAATTWPVPAVPPTPPSAGSRAPRHERRRRWPVALDPPGDRRPTGGDGDDRVRPAARARTRGRDRRCSASWSTDDTVVAWFSDMVAQEAIVITGRGDDTTLALGPKRDRVCARRPDAPRPALPQGVVDRARHLRRRRSPPPGARCSEEQQDFIRDSGWWNSDDRAGGAASSPGSSVR